MYKIAGLVDINNRFSEPVVNKICEEFSDSSNEINVGIHKTINARFFYKKNSFLNEEKENKFIFNFGEYTILSIGELYNLKEIEKDLKECKSNLKNKYSTEVFLKSYIHFGKNCLNKFNGGFSFVIWNNLTKELFMARDKIGLKPLFYYEYENGIMFSSDVSILLNNPLVKNVIDENGLKEIFFIGPGRTPGYGIIDGIKELLPGGCAVFSLEKGLKKHLYWYLKAKEFTDSLNVATEKTRFLIEDAIKKQINSKNPVCCLLSGGLDSSIISKVTSDYYKSNSLGTLTTYSVDYLNNNKYFKKNFYQPDTDENFINTMVNTIKSNHKVVTLSNGNLANALYDATMARGFPGMADIDASLLLLLREIRKEFSIAITGECADEIFGGYPWYHSKDILFRESFPWVQSLDIRKQILKKDLLKNPEDYVYQRYKESIARVSKLGKESKLSLKMREMFVLNLKWFMQTLLERGNKMGEYAGIDIKTPFCDYRIVEYAYNMPWEIKSFGGREKGIIRKAMKGILPDEIVLRKKSPFPKTYSPSYTKAVCLKVKEILKNKNSVLSSILDYNNILSLMEKSSDLNIAPWYGQLMRVPQMMAYIIQLDCWIKKFSIEIDI